MEFLSKFGTGKLIGMGAIAASIIVAMIFLFIKLLAPPMSILYSNLSSDDSVLIVSRLQALGVPHEIGNNGAEVLVPVSRAMQLRMTFAQEGIPSSGTLVGYEIFDKSETLGTSQFVYNVNLVRALEGELVRTISSLAPIESARVHLVLPKKEMFSKEASDPSAAVVIKLKGSSAISKSEVAGISHIILTAVPGMKLDNISIVDNRGRSLKAPSSENSNIAAMTDNAADYQRDVEEKLKYTLEQLLEKSVGVGKIKVNVASEINFDREIVNSEVFDPEGQVIRSKKTSEENESDKGASAQLTAGTNISPQTQSGDKGARSRSKNDEVTNYEISKTITNKISENGRIKKLSIAILVDGAYKKTDSGKDGEEKFEYQPRTDEELNKIKALASSAVGIDLKRGDKIEVINMQFSEEFAAFPQKEKPFAWIRDELDNIVQTVVIGVVIILLILLVIRPAVMRALEIGRRNREEVELQESLAVSAAQVVEKARAQEAAEQEELPDFSAMSNEEKRKMNLLKHINDVIEKHPEETVAIIRNWLYSSE